MANFDLPRLPHPTTLCLGVAHLLGTLLNTQDTGAAPRLLRRHSTVAAPRCSQQLPPPAHLVPLCHCSPGGCCLAQGAHSCACCLAQGAHTWARCLLPCSLMIQVAALRLVVCLWLDALWCCCCCWLLRATDGCMLMPPRPCGVVAWFLMQVLNNRLRIHAAEAAVGRSTCYTPPGTYPGPLQAAYHMLP